MATAKAALVSAPGAVSGRRGGRYGFGTKSGYSAVVSEGYVGTDRQDVVWCKKRCVCAHISFAGEKCNSLMCQGPERGERAAR